MSTRLVAFHRGYSTRTPDKLAGQVRKLHVLRPELVGTPPNQHEAGLCGIHAWNVTDSPRIGLDPFPVSPPHGLTWCPACLGHAAARCGLTDTLARLVAAAVSS